VRMYFSRSGGALGKTGSLSFIFDRKALFTLNAEGLDVEELELDLIDFGLEEIFEEEGKVYIYTPFTEFGAMQSELEKRKLALISSELIRLPTTTVELTPEQEEEINAVVEKMEDDDDVLQVFTNMK
jgi:transcriptional/translational regulatory protein YebC/TACO1